MGPLIFVALAAWLVIVVGFALQGMLLGMANLGRVGRRVFWPGQSRTGSPGTGPWDR